MKSLGGIIALAAGVIAASSTSSCPTASTFTVTPTAVTVYITASSTLTGSPTTSFVFLPSVTITTTSGSTSICCSCGPSALDGTNDDKRRIADAKDLTNHRDLAETSITSCTSSDDIYTLPCYKSSDEDPRPYCGYQHDCHSSSSACSSCTKCVPSTSIATETRTTTTTSVKTVSDYSTCVPSAVTIISVKTSTTLETLTKPASTVTKTATTTYISVSTAVSTEVTTRSSVSILTTCQTTCPSVTSTVTTSLLQTTVQVTVTAPVVITPTAICQDDHFLLLVSSSSGASIAGTYLGVDSSGKLAPGYTINQATPFTINALSLKTLQIFDYPINTNGHNGQFGVADTIDGDYTDSTTSQRHGLITFVTNAMTATNPIRACAIDRSGTFTCSAVSRGSFWEYCFMGASGHVDIGPGMDINCSTLTLKAVCPVDGTGTIVAAG